MAKKKKQTIGYKYFASGHFVLCHGPIDSIVKISFQDKDAYLSEERTNRVISINKPSLFGGDEQSGGVQGNIELLFGHATQQKSSTLQRICTKISDAFGGLISAYRGVCSVVFDNVYIGTSPTMPDSKWRVKRIHTQHDGQLQWYDEKAAILAGSFQKINVVFVLDGSGSMLEIVNGTGKTRWQLQNEQISKALDFFISFSGNAGVGISIFGDPSKTNGDSIYRSITSQGDIEELKSFITDWPISIPFGTYWDYGMSGAKNIFDANSEGTPIVIFTTDGDVTSGHLAPAVAIRNGIPDVQVYGISIDSSAITNLNELDNTGGAVVASSAGNEVLNAYIESVQTVSYFDMNPAHIIRECLTNKIWGIGISESNCDDESFKKSADTLYFEQMGMSIKWTDSTSINEFVDNIKEHINAQLYLDRVTNKWKLYLIRDDYDIADLISLDESNIRNLDFERRTLAECVNSVTVTYWDRERAKDSTVTVQDIARIAQQGGVISQAVDYKGFTRSELASRISLRDLKTLSSTLASVSFDVDESFSESWHEGMPFKLSDESYGLSEAVMRIRTIKRGDGINNTVYVEAIEDSFSSPMQSVVEYVPPITSGDSTAKNATAIAFEVPYIELVEQYGQDEVDAKLSNYPDLGYAGMAAIRPNNQHINASLYVDAGAGYDERTTLDFCPSASLKNDIGYMDSSFEIQSVVEFELLEVNHRIQVNNEIMAFVSFDTATNMLTVKRGCFDTVPQKHATGSKVFGWDNYSGIDNLEYLRGEVLSLKALTLTGSDVLEFNEATAHSLTLSSRAIRPYPPANVKINDQYYPQDIETDLILTWVDRNRIQQTGGGILGWYEGGVAIELGTQTHLILTQLDENNIELATTNTNVTGTTSYTMPISSMQADARFVRVILKTVRDGYECLNPFTHTVELSQFFSAPYDLTVEFKND